MKVYDELNLLDPKVVVPYATFAFDRLTPAREIRAFVDEMERAGFADRLALLRPLDALEPADLTSPGAARRRRFLRRWLSATAMLVRVDRRLQRFLAYRFLKRLRRVVRPPEDAPMVDWGTT